ncbi:DedA family protein [Brevibacillus daliensis]|uniref:DedA family protein n=1 Tax=Brevibacillus daliensis TaxID=2892995 RepID=UPI001E2F8A41|nr:DedA family protein [Brevibacillus daliensis]
MAHLDWLITGYGYIGIFSALTLGIVGIPVPDELLLTYVGFIVFQGKMMYLLALVSAFLGAATGISISYAIGLKLGLPFLKKFGPKIHITQGRIEYTKNLFNKYGNVVLIVGYFIPGVRHITAYLAGISRMELWKFMIFAYSGALLWSITFISLGHKLGERWVLVERYIHRYGFYSSAGVILLLVGIIAYLKFRRTGAKV